MNEKQKQLFDQLTKLQQRMCTHVISGMTQRQAYKLAGGRAESDVVADSCACEILSNPKVVAFMDAMNERAISDAVMTRKEALEKLSLLARTDLKDLVEFGSYDLGGDEQTGKPIIQATWKVKDHALQDPAQLAAISELTASKEGIKIKTHSPMDAIKQLSRMLGWDAAQKIDHSSKDGTMSPKGRSLSDFYEDVQAKPGA